MLLAFDPTNKFNNNSNNDNIKIITIELTLTINKGPVSLIDDGNYPRAELLNSITHSLGILFAFVCK